ncbi:MAG: MarR family transcriptional regulator [Microthrixaceae bacterium]
MSNDSTTWDNFRRAHNRVSNRIHADLGQACSLSLSDFEILASLYNAEKRQLRMSRLADLSGLSPSGLTRRFDSLTTRGLVSRETCDDDRRGVLAVLTKEGAKTVKAATPVYERGARDYFYEVLGEKSAKSVGTALAKVAAFNEA